MPPERREEPRRILAVRLDNAGDVVMVGPALRALRARWPAAAITLLASPAGSAAARLLPWIDEVVAHRAVWQDASNALPLDPAREQAFVTSLAARRFDAAFIFTSFSQSSWPPAYACYLAGIPFRAGHAHGFGGSLLTVHAAPMADAAHQVDRNAAVVETAGIQVTDRALAVTPSVEADAAASHALAGIGIEEGDPFVVVAPGASCAARRYEAARYADVAAGLARGLSCPVVISGSPREAALVEEVRTRAASPAVRPLGGDVDIPALAAVLARARLLVANNSGPMHLADAVGCPMVVLFSGTDLEEQWRPRGAPAVLLRRPTSCRPCYRFECPYRMECLDVPPAEVVSAALPLAAPVERSSPVPAGVE